MNLGIDISSYQRGIDLKLAKSEGVKQFVFMSSIIVYGESAGIGKTRVITTETPLTPSNFYGDSKVKAEEALKNEICSLFQKSALFLACLRYACFSLRL